MSAIISTATGVAGNVGTQLQQTTSRVGNRLQVTSNRLVPPEQRKEIFKRVHLFATHNPKLAAFLGAQITLIGIPLIIFLIFAIATLFVSLTTCILLSIIIALGLAFFAIGIALLFLIPTVFIASCSATFIFLWGFLGYVVLRRFNRIEAFEKRGSGNAAGDKSLNLNENNTNKSGSWNGNANGSTNSRPANPDEPSSISRQTSFQRGTGGADWNQNGELAFSPQDARSFVQNDDFQNQPKGNSGRNLGNPRASNFNNPGAQSFNPGTQSFIPGTPNVNYPGSHTPSIHTNAPGNTSHVNGGPMHAADGTQEWEDKWKNEGGQNSKEQKEEAVGQAEGGSEAGK